MKKYTVLNHTADIGIRAYGKTIKEAFENAALGMFSLITDLDKVEEKVSFNLSLEADDEETLLAEWLNELIYLFEVKKMLLKKFAIGELEKTKLSASVSGEELDLKRHTLMMQIKAATYHMLKVTHKENWEVQVIFDV